MLDPITFCFEHYGRRVAPDSPLGWLKAPGITVKRGVASRPVEGVCIFISESHSLVFGLHYPNAGIVAAEQGYLAFRDNLLYSPPAEPWLMIGFAKADIDPRLHLILNTSQDESVVVEKSGKVIRRSRPTLLREASQVFDGFKPAQVIELLDLLNKNRVGATNQLEGEKLATMLEEHGGAKPSEIRKAATHLAKNDISGKQLLNYLKWLDKDCGGENV